MPKEEHWQLRSDQDVINSHEGNFLTSLIIGTANSIQTPKLKVLHVPLPFGTAWALHSQGNLPESTHLPLPGLLKTSQLTLVLYTLPMMLSLPIPQPVSATEMSILGVRYLHFVHLIS
jgi:hypothetical protein